MRKARLFILLTLITLFLLAPIIKPTQQVKAGFYPYTIYVYADVCGAGPWPPPGTLTGIWTYNCFGQRSGWGMSPDGVCRYTEVEYDYSNECQF
jgi:hypothetical protein